MEIKIKHCVILLLLLFSNTLVFAQELYPVEQDSLWGYINNKGKIEIPLMYNQAFYFSEGLAIVKKDGKVGVIDAKNNPVIPLTEKYTEIYDIRKGMVLTLNRDSSSTVFSLNREIILEIDHYDVSISRNGLIEVFEKDSIFLYNKYGKLIHINPSYPNQSAIDFSEGLVNVEKGDKYGFINEDGKVIIDFNYDYAGSFSQGLAPVKKSGKMGYIDKNGELIIPYQFVLASEFQNEMALVKIAVQNDSLYGVIDKKGKYILQPTFISVRHFDFDLGVIIGKKINNYFKNVGMYDLKANPLVDIDEKYDYFIVVNKINKGLILAMSEERKERHLFNNKGKRIADISEYDSIGDLKNNEETFLIPVLQGGNIFGFYYTSRDIKLGYINIKGKTVWQPTD